MLYGALMPALINVQDSQLGAREFLLVSLALNLVPFAAVAGLATWGVWGTAYHVYAWWMLGTLGLCVLLTLSGVIYRWLNPGKG